MVEMMIEAYDCVFFQPCVLLGFLEKYLLFYLFYVLVFGMFLTKRKKQHLICYLLHISSLSEK